MTGEVFLAAFLGCLLAIEAHTLFARTVIEPYRRRAAAKLTNDRPRVIECDPSEVETITKMLDADQKLKIAALDFGELAQAQVAPVSDEIVSRLKAAAFEFAYVLPPANKARIREDHAFTIESRSK